MAGQPSVDDSFSFIGGLNTEGGYFTTPKNSWTEGQNVVPKQDGSIERRPAVVFEENYAYLGSSNLTNEYKHYAYVVDTWTNVGGQRNENWFVVQEGPTVYFYKAFTGTVSGRPVTATWDLGPDYVGPFYPQTPFSFNLLDFRCANNNNLPETSPISCTTAYGNLIITHQDCDPILLEWREGDNIRITSMKLLMRDFKGIQSPVADTTKYTQASWEAIDFWPQAIYNLYNQGWYDTQIGTYKTANSSKYPTNTEQWWRGKDTNDAFSATVLAKIDFGTAPAPKGRFILEAFNEDRAAALSQVYDVNADSTTTTTGSPGQQDYFQPYWQESTGI